MAAEKTKNPPPPAEPYTNIEMRLVCASKIKIVNGEDAGTEINWDSDMLRVYLYLFNQVKGFENSGGEFYQSQDKIRLSTGLGKTKLNEVLGALKKLGLIQSTGKKAVKGAPRGLVKYTASRLMDVIRNLEIVFADDNGEPVWDHDRASGKKKKKKSGEKRQHGESEPTSSGDVNGVNPHKAGCTDEEATPQAEPADQNPDLAAGSAAPSAVGQHDRVASDNNSGGHTGPDDDHTVNPAEEQEKGQEEGQAYHYPWKGDTFIKNHLSENAYKWALEAGATDWHHACRLVWEKIEVSPPTEIDECYKPLSLC